MGLWEGAEQAMVDKWVEARIATLAVDLDAISAGLSGRVYLDAAPRDAEWPVIVYQCQDPPRDVRGVGLVTVMVDTLYLVKAIAQAGNDVLAPIVSTLHRAMTTATGSAVDDGAVLTSVRNEQFSMTDMTEGATFRHLGGIYRIQAQG